jgi:hypothetical protein
MSSLSAASCSSRLKQTAFPWRAVSYCIARPASKGGSSGERASAHPSAVVVAEGHRPSRSPQVPAHARILAGVLRTNSSERTPRCLPPPGGRRSDQVDDIRHSVVKPPSPGPSDPGKIGSRHRSGLVPEPLWPVAPRKSGSPRSEPDHASPSTDDPHANSTLPGIPSRLQLPKAWRRLDPCTAHTARRRRSSGPSRLGRADQSPANEPNVRFPIASLQVLHARRHIPLPCHLAVSSACHCVPFVPPWQQGNLFYCILQALEDLSFLC